MQPIIIVRHGQAEHNVSDLTGGWTDSSLTELGERQARAVAERLGRELKGHNVRILSSDLKRAKQTCEAIAGVLGLSPEYHKELREFNNGVAANKRRDEVKDFYREVTDPIVDWQPYPESETWRTFHHRVAGFMDKVLEIHDRPLLIVCHGGTVNQLLSWWLQFPVETLNTASFHSAPTAITVLTLSGFKERQIERLNDASHLAEVSGIPPIPFES
ncbi:MAG: histidine phosphatase family protein [Candidatus Bathyarchaeota archaeon]|nr:histidine phosphatase family protein [Candidatus Bathyarchaeota archaeon]